MADIFLSHSSQDKAVADKLCEELEAKGLKCWIAPRDIIPGSEWAAAISNAISETRVMIVIYSKNSAASTQVPKELNIAEKKGKFIIPYKIDDTELTGAFDYFFTGAHWIIANPAMNDYKIDELYGVITGVLQVKAQNVTNNTYIDNVTINQAPPQQAAPAPTPAPASTSSSSEKKFDIKSPKTIAIIAAAVAAIAAVVIIPMAVNSSKNDDTAIEANANVSESVTTAADTSAAETAAAEPVRETGSIDFNIRFADKTFFDSNYFEGKYTGELVNGLPDGNGKFTGSDKDGHTVTYTGGFLAGEFSGEGSVEYIHANTVTVTIEGSWEENKCSGKCIKEIKYDNGENWLYDGEWKDGMLNGQGSVNVKASESDWSYEGGWIEGSWHGQGTHTIKYKNGDSTVYEGEYKVGKLNGKVKQTIINSKQTSVFEGEYLDGARSNGIMTETFNEGDITKIEYEGSFNENNNHNGHGKKIVTYASGAVNVREGEFYDGKFASGTMTESFAEGDILKIVNEGIYGARGYLHGQGTKTIYYTNGIITVREGEFTEGKFIKGTMTGSSYPESDGITKQIFDGTFGDSGYLHGQGKKTIYYTNGEEKVEEGQWDEGKFIG